MLLAIFVMQSVVTTPPPPTSALDLNSPTIMKIDGRKVNVVDPDCDSIAGGNDIVVCGRRRSDLYRLPLRDEPTDTDARVRGGIPTGVAAITPYARCGIFAGERHCSKAEAARYGYGNGRDPITLIGKIVTKVVDPDAN